MSVNMFFTMLFFLLRDYKILFGVPPNFFIA